MTAESIPTEITNRVGAAHAPASDRAALDKISPATGKPLFRFPRSSQEDVQHAVGVAAAAQPGWRNTTPVARGALLFRVVEEMEREQRRMAEMVAAETGKSPRDALGEVGAACALGRFYAGEGQRFYGRTTTSGVPGKSNQMIRQPIGVAGLIIAANTPIANVAWKVFPALICGNAAVLKSAEDTPGTAWLFGQLAERAGLPPGVLNIVHGLGTEAGAPLVRDGRVGVVSFTGSTSVGREIARVTAERLARVSLELGGKNPLLVCDDADLDNACKWVLLSAFSNAGQRCAAASRIIIMSAVYEQFRARLVERTRALRVGPTDDDDFGPVINAKSRDRILGEVRDACARGATLLSGGHALGEGRHAGGCYIEPTLLENVDPSDRLSQTELFGPVAALYRAESYDDGLRLANHASLGLTASIHTRSVDRALDFCDRVQAGVASVNGGTHGSEPHMPFGGVKDSGNGTREPGTEALDVYSNLKNVCIQVAADRL
jgi:alpha-ketoglutaric semialdehyde dehydrogenase